MAQYKSEYSQATVGSPACSYSKLGCYLGSNPTMATLKPGSVTGVYVTPNYNAIGYDALTHGGAGSCNSYFNIQDAYGAGAGNCSMSYTSRLCGGDCNGGGPGKGTAWRCAKNKPGGGDCIPVHPGTPGGMTYPTYDECKKAGCPYKV